MGDEALAEEDQKMDKKEKQRNRRMFGNLLGTLQRFKQDETRVKVREQKKLWEKNKRREMQYIKTTTTVEGQPQIFYLPKEHNDKTTAKHEASLAAIEEEIKTAKASFEEDLLKIESKMSQNPDSLMRDEDLIHEDDEENEETENKPRSVITVAQPT